MIIRLDSSQLFSKDPAIRFADEYKVSPDIWRDIWRRHKLLGYNIPELCEIYYIKVGTPIKRRKMNEWIFKTEIYMMTYDKVAMGVQAVNSTFFGNLEQRLISEILRSMKYGDTKHPSSMA